MIPERPLGSLTPCIVGRDGKPLVRSGLTGGQASESCLPEEELLGEEEEADMTFLPQNVSRLPHVYLRLFAPVKISSRRNW